MTEPQQPATESPATTKSEEERNPLLRLALEMGPLLIFFVMNKRAGILTGTAWFMGAMAISLVISRIVERRWPVMPLVTALFVGVFGGLTLVFQDDTFIKLKPTIVNVLFGVALLVGLSKGRYLLKIMFGSAFDLVDEGWHKLTVRWSLFFFLLAILNEIVWRNFDSDTWINFKVWILLPLTVIFGMFQLGLIKRYEVRPATAEADA